MSRQLLLTTAAIAIAAAGGKAPDWVQLLPAEAVTKGKTWTGNDGRGPFRVDDAMALLKVSCSEIDVATKTGKCDLLLDYDHQADEPAALGLAKPAAGWIKQLQIRDDGVYGQVDWTDRAAAMVVAREYRFISPVYGHMKDGEIKALLRASLTNTPNFNMQAVASRDVQEESMKTVEEVLAALRKVLGLKDTDDLNACMTAVASVAAASKQAEKLQGLITAVATKLGVKADAPQAAFETAIAARGTGASETDKLIAGLQTEINQLKAVNAKTAATEEVEKAIAAGKISPAQKDWALGYATRDPAGFKEFVEKQPVIITDSAARVTPPAGVTRDSTSEDAEVARQLGIDPAKMKKGA
jgi:phage I-like protein